MGLDNIKNYIVGILMSMVIVVVGLYYLGSLINVDPSLSTELTDSLADNINKSSDITTQVNQMKASLDTNAKGGALGWIDVLLGSAWNGLKVLGSGLDFMGGIFSFVGTFFGIPDAVVGLIMLVITVIIIISIWIAIMRLG